MRDVSGALMPEGKPFTIADHNQFLDTMATMHAAFWGDAQLDDSRLGLRSPAYFFTSQMDGAEGCDLLEHLLEPDVAKVVRTLLQNPQPLYDALVRYPSTLVHNDLWWANLGIIRGEYSRVVMLDWDFATLAPPAVELAFYIGENTGYLPVPNDAVVEAYRIRLEQHLGPRFDEEWWLPQVDLCFLGCFLRRGKWLLLAVSWVSEENQRTQYMDELAWWSDHIRRGAQRL
jgi:aminoglycoside phosphotransferase (APT) family kinase protein